MSPALRFLVAAAVMAGLSGWHAAGGEVRVAIALWLCACALGLVAYLVLRRSPKRRFRIRA